MKHRYPHGATPLNADEAAGLIPDHITTQAALNQWEQQNILEGMAWADRQTKRDLLDESFIRDLHGKMFGRTWKWAGTYRRSNKNIGVEWTAIARELHGMLADVATQCQHASFPQDELAVRFHHRLVLIHPFPNGNGRHARLMADLLVHRLGGQPFSWGRCSLTEPGAVREAYIAALRRADRHDYAPLIAFARS